MTRPEDTVRGEAERLAREGRWIGVDAYRDKLLAALDELVAERDRLDENIRGALDVLTGFSRPMNNAERISFATRILNAALGDKEQP